MNTIRKVRKGFVAWPFFKEDTSVKWQPWHLYTTFKPLIFQRKKDAIDYYGSSIPIFNVTIILSRPSKEIPEMEAIQCSGKKQSKKVRTK